MRCIIAMESPIRITPQLAWPRRIRGHSLISVLSNLPLRPIIVSHGKVRVLSQAAARFHAWSFYGRTSQTECNKNVRKNCPFGSAELNVGRSVKMPVLLTQYGFSRWETCQCIHTTPKDFGFFLWIGSVIKSFASSYLITFARVIL